MIQILVEWLAATMGIKVKGKRGWIVVGRAKHVPPVLMANKMAMKKASIAAAPTVTRAY